MRLFRLPSLILSLFLQVAPVLRVASADAALALAPVMAVLRLLVGATAVAGSFHAVSGATAPTISSSKTKVGAVGVNFNYRILLSHGSPESYEVVPIPPGLTLNGSQVQGVPTATGETVSQVSAWDNPDFTGDTISGEVTFFITDIEPLAPSLPAGSPVTFRVIGPVTAQVLHQWQHNDVDIANATNSSLTLPAVAELDAGQYRARIRFGTTFTFTQRATLTVTPPSNPPTFTTTPSDAKLHLAEPLLLRAEATGEGELTFAWTKDGNPVPGETSANLQRASITLDDAGSYRVTVTGSGGSATSPPAVVTVADPLVIGAVTLNGGNLLLPFNGIAGRTYLLESLVNLSAVEWQTAAEPLPGDAGTFTVPAPAGDTQVFRVRTN